MSVVGPKDSAIIPSSRRIVRCERCGGEVDDDGAVVVVVVKRCVVMENAHFLGRAKQKWLFSPIGLVCSQQPQMEKA